MTLLEGKTANSSERGFLEFICCQDFVLKMTFVGGNLLNNVTGYFNWFSTKYW